MRVVVFLKNTISQAIASYADVLWTRQAIFIFLRMMFVAEEDCVTSSRRLSGPGLKPGVECIDHEPTMPPDPG